MTLLQRAAHGLDGLWSPKAGLMLVLALLTALLPSHALAGEADVVLNFTSENKIYLYISLGFGLLAIVTAWLLAQGVMAQSAGSEKMQEVGLAIREGALAYLKQQVKLMIVFVILLAIGLFFLFGKQEGNTLMTGAWVALSFVGGVAASYIAGYSGMLMAVAGNMRTANAALTSYKRSLEVAFRSGAVAGMVTVGMGLIGATLIILFGGERAMTLLVGFGFGGSLAALFMRVGGGIFTKAADVGADLVGKVEAGIPEDDPRNPATIADNVGDNVGDCAGMAADVFESYEVTLVAAIVLGAATAAIFDTETWMRLILFALMARGVGILASVIGIYSVRGSDDIDADPLKSISKGFYASAFVALVATAGLAWFMMGGNGNPIRTAQLRNLEDLRRESFAELRAERDRMRTANSTIGDLPIEELQKSEVAKRLGVSSQNMGEMVMRALQHDPETAAAVPSLKGYHRLTPGSNSPALKWATMLPGEKPGDEPRYITLEQYLQEDQKVFRLHLKRPEGPIPGSQPQQRMPAMDQQIWYGPIEEKVLDAQLAQMPKDSNLTVSKLDRREIALFANEDGRIALAVLGEVEQPLLLNLNPLTVWKGTPEAAKKASSPGAAPTDPKPEMVSNIQYAVAQSATVPWWTFFLAIAFGIFMAFAIERLTDYYVSTHKKPVQEVAGVSSAGPAPMIIQGFAYAAESSVFMVFAIVFALLFPLFLFSPGLYGSYILSFYGIALVGLGLLTTTGYVLAMDTFGPISDNAQGVFEMSGAGHESETGSKAVQRLDAAGNTTKALTKGFAIATAVVAAVALFHSYLEDARLGELGLRLDIPEIFLGLLIGGAAPYLFSAFAINAVGRASFQLINEVRRQFRSDPGIMAGTSKPNYGACVSIVTAAAQKELLGPGILAIALPVAVAFGFSIGKDPVTIGAAQYNLTGAQALGGFLAGAILSGQLMAVLLANSGGMWDNAKKLIEDGLYGGKGTDAHKAGVVCDTVGDPFKDTAGPALNPLIKVMNLVALLLAPVVIAPFSNTTLWIITAAAVVALAVSIYFSKRGSLSSELQKAAESGEKADEHFSHPSLDPGSKRKITVEEPLVEPVHETTSPEEKL